MSERPVFPRRLFLKRSMQVAGLVILPVAHWTGSGCARGGEPDAGLVTFSAAELAIADSFARTLIPDGGAFEPGAGSVDLARHLDAQLSMERPAVVSAVGTALWLLELAPLFVIGKPRRFTHLDRSARDAYLAALPTSFGVVREAYSALRFSFMFLFYNLDETWKPLGYDGPWVVEVDRTKPVADNGA